jgi:AraC family transcriptional regulator
VSHPRHSAGFTIEAELQLPIATVQLARFDLPEPQCTVMHEHDSFWLDLCLTPRPANACAFFEGSGRRYYAPIGDILLVPPGRRIRTRSAAGTQRSILCHLRAQEMQRWLDIDFEWTDDRLQEALHVGNAHIRALLLRLSEEARMPGIASDTMAELIASQIALELARHYHVLKERPACGGLSPVRLRRIDDRLREGGKAPSLTDLALLCGVSVRQLTRGFRESRGVSIGQHIARVRRDQAMRMLAAGTPVKSVAFAMGFASASSFAQAFRRETGYSPSFCRDQSAAH